MHYFINLSHHHARNKHPGNIDDVNNRMPIKWYKTVSTCMFHESWLLFSEARHWLPRTRRLIKSTKKDFYLYSARVKTHFPSETVSRYHAPRLRLFKTTIHVKPTVGLGPLSVWVLEISGLYRLTASIMHWSIFIDCASGCSLVHFASELSPHCQNEDGVF